MDNFSPKLSNINKTFLFFIQGWIDAFRDITSVMERFQTESRPFISLGLLLLSILTTWFVYVPVHELLHVAGCIFCGGEVSEVILDRKYGATFLNKIFPFIIPSNTSAYAGRLSGFDPGSDIGYLITVFTPYILTIFPGVFLLLISSRIKKMWVAGIGMILGLSPFMSLTGDYFEIGTILSTRIWNIIFLGFPANSIDHFWSLRSDDIFLLISEIIASPNLYGLPGIRNLLQIIVVISFGLFLAILLSGWTYKIGRFIALKILQIIEKT